MIDKRQREGRDGTHQWEGFLPFIKCFPSSYWESDKKRGFELILSLLVYCNQVLPFTTERQRYCSMY